MLKNLLQPHDLRLAYRVFDESIAFCVMALDGVVGGLGEQFLVHTPQSWKDEANATPQLVTWPNLGVPYLTCR